jgi:nicotinate-nucleotide adenylyltransferase
MKIGILGGTFNPPHTGHLMLAEYVCDFLSLDKVIFVPCNLPPHKSQVSLPTGDSRLKMLRLAIGNNENFKINNLEIARGGISFTVDTLKVFTKKWFNQELFFIIGSDLYKEFNNWKEPETIKRLAKVVVVKREEIDNPDKSFIFIDMPKIDISSSFVRKRIQNGLSVKYFVPSKVIRFIYKQGFYR